MLFIQVMFKKKNQYVIDNIHYCLNCVKASVSIDEFVVSESKKIERTFDG